MTTAKKYPHIEKIEGSSAHLKSHPRTRVAMIVMDYQARGLSSEEIVRHYPYLKLAEVHAAMAYYYDHPEEIDAEIESELDDLDHQPNANSQTAVWRKLKANGLI
jgi:hypothetical protein